MILYANGDSNTAGAELSDYNNSFVVQISDYLNMQLVNEAMGGHGNDYIMRSTKEWLSANNKPDLLIIGWTSPEREEWYHNGQYYHVNPSIVRRNSKPGYTERVEDAPVELKAKHKEWILNNTWESMVKKSTEWHDKIWLFHNELLSQNIKHLFFNATHQFFADKHLKQMDWDGYFLGAYTDSDVYLHYLTKKGCTQTANSHFLEDGHKEWTKVLLSALSTNKL
jgi:hypothetical protein